VSDRLCPACQLDPDPRGWSACSACRKLNDPDRQRLHADYEHLQRLYKESYDYVETLQRERNDLVAAAKRHVNEVNQLDARVEQLESALSEALQIVAREMLSEERGKPEHLARLPQLQAVLTKQSHMSTTIDQRRLHDGTAALAVADEAPRSRAEAQTRLDQLSDAIAALQSLDDLGEDGNRQAAEDLKKLWQRYHFLERKIAEFGGEP
jgi:chromosome segregation ATPase